MTRNGWSMTEQPKRSGRASRVATLALAALAGAFALTLTACDPCTGVASCATGGAYLAATGQIVDRITGQGVDGVRIDVVRTGGIGVEQDSVSAITSDGGFWRVQLAPAGEGTLDVDVQVSPPGEPGYRVRGLRFMTRLHGGDANLNQAWVSTPYFSYAGELYLRGTTDDRIQGRPIQFRLTGGVQTRGTGVRDSVFRATTDAGGRVELFPQREQGGLLPLGGDDLIGDLTVDLGAPLGPSTVRDVRLTPSYVYFGQVRILRLAVGP